MIRLVTVLLILAATAAEAECVAPSFACVCKASQVVAEATVLSTDGRLTTVRLDQVYGVGPDAGVPGEIQVDARTGDASGKRLLVFLYGEVPDGGTQFQLSEVRAARVSIESDGTILCEYAEQPVRLDLAEAVELALDPSCNERLAPRLGNPGCNDTGFGCQQASSATGLFAVAAVIGAWLRRRQLRLPRFILRRALPRTVGRDRR